MLWFSIGMLWFSIGMLWFSFILSLILLLLIEAKLIVTHHLIIT